jgi:hypothetical protein
LARAGLGFASDDDYAFRRRQEAERRRNSESFEREALQARENAERSRLIFEENARAGAIGEDADKVIGRRDQAREDEEAARRRGDSFGELEAQQRRRRAELELDQIIDSSSAPEAAAIRSARSAADALDTRAAREDEILRSTERGRELSRTPAERAARELGGQLIDLQNSFEDQRRALSADADRARDAGVPFDLEARQAELRAASTADRQRIIQEDFRSRAPGIFALRDSVENAVLQGPSRAALNAADINTEQGRSELNRLLRGDDPAKQADVVELQKQSTLLQTVIDLLREQGVPLVVN